MWIMVSSRLRWLGWLGSGLLRWLTSRAAAWKKLRRLVSTATRRVMDDVGAGVGGGEEEGEGEEADAAARNSRSGSG